MSASAASKRLSKPKKNDNKIANASKDQGPRRALGRGLAALMPTAPPSGAKQQPADGGFRLLPIERICANKLQPRKQFDETALAELAASIKAQGVLQPLVVRRLADGYEIVAGERRWRAAARAGIKHLPVVIKELSDAKALEVALIENVQRQDLDPLEEAEAYSRLIRDHKLTHDQIAAAVGKSRSAISNSIRLLKLPESVLVLLADGRLTAGHARALMMLDDKVRIEQLAEELVGRHASVRDAELKVRRLAQHKSRQRKNSAAQSNPQSAAHSSVQERLQQALGTRVKLVEEKGSGHIEIYFHSLDALDSLLDQLIR